MAALLQHVKSHVAGGPSKTPAVPAKLCVQLLAAAKAHLEAHGSPLMELPLTDGRLVVVGDTHGQLNDFCWILKAHGPGAPTPCARALLSSHCDHMLVARAH